MIQKDKKMLKIKEIDIILIIVKINLKIIEYFIIFKLQKYL